MNPYDFARIDWTKLPRRKTPIWHHRLSGKTDQKLYSGSMEIDVYAETPLFIADPRNEPSDDREPARSMQNEHGDYIIPGSSLKGMLRNVVEALGNGCLTQFHFRLTFTNLEADEFGALVLAVALEDQMRHKIGYGKPLGLGSVYLQPISLTLIDYSSRYTNWKSGQGNTLLEGEPMWEVLYRHMDEFSEKHLQQLAMEDLRRIWLWPPETGVNYYYPSKREWFNKDVSKGKRIRDTKNVP